MWIVPFDAAAEPNFSPGTWIAIVLALVQVVGFLFLRGNSKEIDTLKENIATSLQQSDSALAKNGATSERLTKAEGRVDVIVAHVEYLKERQESSLNKEVYVAETRAQTAEIARTISGLMKAVRPEHGGRVDERRDDSDPPSGLPPMRPRLPSRR